MTSLWKFEEKVYRVQGLVEVMADGLSNDVVGINQEHYAAALMVVRDLVEEMTDMINLEYKQRREHKKYDEFREEDYDEDGEDSLFAGASLFSGLGAGAGAQPIISLGDDVQDSEPQVSEETKESDVRFPTGSLGVTLVKEHDDGSATFEVNGSKEQMGKLFSAFFTDAIVRGIDSTEQQTEQWLLRNRIIKKAKELEEQLKKWEVTDEYDYLPEVQKTREELTNLFNQKDMS